MTPSVPNAPRPRPRQTVGFTLIELLTVIAIIGVLAGLLLVGLQGVRQSANTAKCVAHWRQWDAALKLYIGDNKGYLPETSFAGDEVWIQLSPYLSFEGVEGLKGQKLDVMQGIIRRDASCPVEDWGYGFNVFLTNSAQDSNGETVAVAKPFATIEMPAQTIFGIDMRWPKRWLDGTVIKGGGSEDYLASAPTMPHNGMVNVLYLDGHVATKHVSEIMKAEMTRPWAGYNPSHDDEPIADAN